MLSLLKLGITNIFGEFVSYILMRVGGNSNGYSHRERNVRCG